MAVRSLAAATWERGVAEPTSRPAAWADPQNFTSGNNELAHYTITEKGDKPTSDSSNAFGVSNLRSWPDLFNGTANGTPPKWWQPAKKVDVLICGGKQRFNTLSYSATDIYMCRLTDDK